jgi:ATP-dependent protease ClpP protease subunit
MNLRINSPGGLIHDSFAVYNMIKQSPMEITAYIDGLAASCASWVPLACNKVFITPQSEMMIHDPYTMMMGGSDDLRKEATHLDSLKSTIVNIYTEKTGMEKSKIESMMKEGTWMNGTEAVNNGFADDFSEQSMAAACVFDLSILSNIPKGFLKYQNALNTGVYFAEKNAAGEDLVARELKKINDNFKR